MDTNFYEFWGRSFLNVAEGKRQMSEFNNWLRQGLSGSDSLSALFRQVYGLEKPDREEEGGEEYLKLYEKALHSFQQSFREYLRLFDVVHREEHETLAKECEALKQQVAEQERTIGQLRKILSEKGMESAESVQNLQDVLKKQTDQFQEMMQTMGTLFQQKSSKSK
jgi:hypothetical protein